MLAGGTDGEASGPSEFEMACANDESRKRLFWEHEVGGSSPAAPTGNPIWAAGGALVVLASDQLGAVPRRAGALARKHVLYWQRSQAQLRAPETQPGVDQPVER